MDSTLQNVLVAVTCVAMAAWLATVASAALRLARARAGDDPNAVVDRAGSVARVSSRVTLPAALVVAVAGGWYVLGRDLSIDPNWWIGTAVASWLVATFGSTLVRARQLRGAAELAERDGAGDEEVQWRIRRADLTSRGELVLLLVATLVVALQPTAPL